MERYENLRTLADIEAEFERVRLEYTRWRNAPPVNAVELEAAWLALNEHKQIHAHRDAVFKAWCESPLAWERRGVIPPLLNWIVSYVRECGRHSHIITATNPLPTATGDARRFCLLSRESWWRSQGKGVPTDLSRLIGSDIVAVNRFYSVKRSVTELDGVTLDRFGFRGVGNRVHTLLAVFEEKGEGGACVITYVYTPNVMQGALLGAGKPCAWDVYQDRKGDKQVAARIAKSHVDWLNRLPDLLVKKTGRSDSDDPMTKYVNQVIAGTIQKNEAISKAWKESGRIAATAERKAYFDDVESHYPKFKKAFGERLRQRRINRQI